ncbi:hypothetical protein RFI_23887 [Reticulomyxa filosa]|uniref:Uncharacterized protein n=1 Tax=Reticulomyxa filosa TaxID=46433 RepID=X6MHZ3_RETFI|nr:hypothetical protein RFI_23887 [Reticulomyxa filosa]|eukprot:ETO13479.1 hypothetical protein RFI_23887 [Reticulomyxa filosa]
MVDQIRVKTIKKKTLWRVIIVAVNPIADEAVESRQKDSNWTVTKKVKNRHPQSKTEKKRKLEKKNKQDKQ